MLQIEQFIESIFPTQDAQRMTMLQKAQVNRDQEQNAESRRDTYILLAAVVGTMAVMGIFMVSSSTSVEYSTASETFHHHVRTRP